MTVTGEAAVPCDRRSGHARGGDVTGSRRVTSLVQPPRWNLQAGGKRAARGDEVHEIEHVNASKRT
ncbi:MAG: hypothetical protein M3276_02615 [Actinomycetota bacterium]|nr:hypothetical protein [Actinomycetota bacterium]